MAIDTLGAALRQIGRLFAGGVVSSRSDRELLDLFLDERDPAAFEVLVARHGPTVLSVCRGVLRDPSDVEDAFQATFLVMVKKAGTIRGRHALGGWLYQVAHRVAIQANKAAARRRACEREAGLMAAARATTSPAFIDQLVPALHEEIARLPARHRLPLVLCDLEGMTHIEAAGELAWSERTLRRRLAEGRDRLKRRLARRGVESDGAAVGAILLHESQCAVPSAWSAATLRAALDLINPVTTAGAVSATVGSLTHEVLRNMLLQKLRLATSALLGTGLLAWAASAALIARGDGPPQPVQAPVAQRAPQAPAPAPTPEPDPLDAVGTFPVRGRVLDPDGKPVAGAEIHVHAYSSNINASATSGAASRIQSGRVTTSDADGAFQFELDKSSSDFPYRDFPAWHGAQIAAVTPGFGPAWFEAGTLLKGKEATLRLVRDDVPIRGRVLDAQGRPVSAVTVQAVEIRAASDGLDAEALLSSGTMDFGRTTSQYTGPTWLGHQGNWTTDGEGRFTIQGLGRDRIVGLVFRSPMLAQTSLYAMARTGGTPPKTRPRPSQPDGMMMIGTPPPPQLVGSTFDQIIGPTKPITGVVRLKGTGQPLGGIQVMGAEPLTWTQVSAATDAQGRFRLLGLPKGRNYQLSASPRSGIDAFLGTSITLTDTEGLKPIEAALELPKGVIVIGRMIDTATGRLVRAKHVSHHKLPVNHNEGQAALSHSGLVDPVFRITVPPGEGMIYANVRGTKPPYARARLRAADKGKGIGGIGDDETTTMRLDAYHAYRMINVPADAQSFAVDLELTRGITRKGRLVGPDGAPVIGAECGGYSDAWAEVTTLTDDTFEVFGLVPGHPREVLFAHKDRRLVGWLIIKDDDLKSDAPIVVKLQRAGSITGRLIDEDGQPLGGARFYVQTEYPWIRARDSFQPRVWPDNQSMTSDADGHFLIDGLKPGLNTSILVAGGGSRGRRLDAGDHLSNTKVQAGETRDVGDVNVKPARDR